jgi:cell division inhibitor SepF
MSSIVKKLKELWSPAELEDEDEEYVEDYYDGKSYSGDRSISKKQKSRNQEYNNKFSISKEKKVVNLQTTAQLQVVVCKPERFAEETRTIADELLKSYTVVLNLEDTDKDNSRRILDFLSGVAYAKVGKIKRIATNTYIITPCNVDITGEELVEGLENNGFYF